MPENVSMIGYARVSKADGSQVHHLQHDALIAAGVRCKRNYWDSISGARDSRPGLDACLVALAPGDTLVIWSARKSSSISSPSTASRRLLRTAMSARMVSFVLQPCACWSCNGEAGKGGVAKSGLPIGLYDRRATFSAVLNPAFDVSSYPKPTVRNAEHALGNVCRVPRPCRGILRPLLTPVSNLPKMRLRSASLARYAGPAARGR
jgi:hypothetical protein